MGLRQGTEISPKSKVCYRDVVRSHKLCAISMDLWGFLKLSILTFGDRKLFVVGSWLAHCGMLNIFSGLYPWDDSKTPPVVTKKKCLQTLANILWMANHPLLRPMMSQFTKSDIRYCSGCIYRMLEKHTGHIQITCQEPPAITKNNRINSFIHSLI